MKYYTAPHSIVALAPDIREQFEGLCSHWMGQHIRTHDENGLQIVSDNFLIGKNEARFADIHLVDAYA